MTGIGQSAGVQLEKNGYTVVRGLLNPSTELGPLKSSYSRLIDELAEIYAKRIGSAVPKNFNQLSFADRLCYLIGISHGNAFHHLDPVLSVMHKSYSWDKELPSAQLPVLSL